MIEKLEKLLKFSSGEQRRKFLKTFLLFRFIRKASLAPADKRISRQTDLIVIIKSL